MAAAQFGGAPKERGAHRGMHIPGAHAVMTRSGEKVGETTTRTDGREFPTLSAARKVARGGDIIVRLSDRVVLSVR